ncbi:MAG TPA: lipoyl synthase [Nitrospiria bacterium]|nr:lipoyl synthase [Nitrospiria bacterium]
MSPLSPGGFPRDRSRLPPWFRVRAYPGPRYQGMKNLVHDLKLHTVCEEARCPNVWDCWNRGTATFMILGDVCTRSCGFCAVATGRPIEPDLDEPRRVAQAVRALSLRHAVITSVNRDELADGGAAIFAETIRAIRRLQDCAIEVLIPDFKGSHEAQDRIFEARPDILNHNTETVPRLYRSVRPQGKYSWSLELVSRAKQAGLVTKSGLMVGLGETGEEVRAVMADLVSSGCDILTLGQYLQPTPNHLPVIRYYLPEEFSSLKEDGLRLGFRHVESGPLVRSSYHAEEQSGRMAEKEIERR